jgi:ABC-type branched-subunit amino acid transport system permease subunit
MRVPQEIPAAADRIALALVALPFALVALGLTLTTATDVVVFAIACMGLNILVGYTGLVSFGHGAWFGLAGLRGGAVAAHWFPGEIVIPLCSRSPASRSSRSSGFSSCAGAASISRC